jgi:TolB-like protein/Tfp pilus assembly protein PilF
MSLFAELKRRNVIRVAVAYAVMGWLLTEVSSVVLPTFDAPEWVMKVLIFVVVLGFFPTLFFSWVFELTPEGVKRESDVDRAASVTSETGRKLDYVTLVALVLVVAFVFVLRDAPTQFSNKPGVVSAGPARDASIAVLPFTTRSRDEDDIFFSDGVHDDLLTQLSKIAELKVISRTSVMEYRDTTKRIPEIAAELGVATVVEGAVQRSGKTVRITAQLIDSQTDEHLWAETYDRELTADNLFAIQTEIATSIAGALQTTLSPEEAAALDQQLTDDLIAMEAYRRAKLHQRNNPNSDFAVVERLLLSALERDPEFAAAWSLMAEAHLSVYWNIGQNPRDRELAWEAIQNGRAITAELPELDIAEGYYHYWGFLDYDSALEVLERARTAIPNDASLHELLAYINRRAGNFDQAVDHFRRARELDPLNSALVWELASTHLSLRQLDQARSLVPTLSRLDYEFGRDEDVLGMIAIQTGDTESARLHFDRSRDTGAYVQLNRAWARMLSGDLQAALELSDLGDMAVFAHGTNLPEQIRGLFHLAAGQSEPANRELGVAKVKLEALVSEQPENGNHLRALCEVVGGLGDRVAAEDVCERAVQHERVDAYLRSDGRFEIARGLANAGLAELALDQIELVLNGPIGPMFPRFEIDPAFQSLHDHPRWQALKAKYGGGE